MMTLSVIDTDLADIILHHRCKNEKENVKDPVNIKFCVLCVSEVIKIKDSQLFLVKLGPTLNIVVKIENLNKWHEKLVLHKEMVFTCVRPTSLQKGSKNAQRVYAATGRSELLLPDDIAVVTVSISDWFNQHGCENRSHTTGIQHGRKICDDLFSYQGTITNILDGCMGVYELDNTVRLYVGKVPAVHKFAQLQIGVTVIVQNAHHRVSQQCPRLCIYCCMLASIKVINCGKWGIATKASDSLKKLLYLSDQTQQELDQVFEARQILRKQFLDSCGERLMEKMFSVIIQTKDIFTCQETARNILDEFLSAPHKCLLQDPNMLPYKKKFVTVDDLKRSIPDINSDSLEWQCIRQAIDPTSVIIGILDMNEQNGEIYLKDCIGNLGVLIASCHGNGNETKCNHKCSASCDCSDQRPGDKFPCSYIHPCCIGKIIAVPVLQYVSETLFTERKMLLKNLCKENLSNKDICDKYVTFSMKDAVFISHFKPVTNAVAEDKVKDLGVGINKLVLPGKKFGSNADVSAVKNSEPVEMPCNEDGTVKNQSNVNNETSNLHRHVRVDGGTFFCRNNTCSVMSSVSIPGNDITDNSTHSADGSIDLNDKNKVVVGKTSFQVNPIVRRKRSQTDSEPVYGTNYQHNKFSRTDTSDILAGNINPHGSIRWDTAVGSENNNQAIGKKEIVIYLENKGSLIAEETYCRFTAECALLNTDTNMKAVFEFRKRASRWYHTLYPNFVYILSVLDTTAPVLSQSLSSERVQRMMLKSNSKKFFTVHTEVDVRQMWDSRFITPDLDHSCFLCRIEEVLNTRNTEKFVSFEGSIIGRHLVKPGFGPRCNMDDKGACGMFSRLHVQDESKKNDIWVYLNDDTIISYRGLIPGARVRFYGLERKVSKSSNVYCRLTAISSVFVLALYSESSRDEMQYIDDQFPSVCLSDLWTTKSVRGQVFQCVCDVEKILKVSLKCLCEKCGSQIHHGTCSNKACDSGLGHRFLARASVIFDDGTSVAMVTLTGSSVQSMLQLSSNQWKCLEEEVRMSGEIFVQQCNTAVGTDMEKFIYFLCDNHSVKKTWLLTFKTKCALDINNIDFDEFSVKHFDTGSSRISTKCLPFLQLECLTLTTFDPVHWSMHHFLHTDSSGH